VQTPQVGAGAQTEAQGQRQGCCPATTRYKGVQIVIDMCLPTSDPLTRDTIHKASRRARNLLQARQRVGRGHEDNGRQMVGISMPEEVTRFLGREVRHDEATPAMLRQAGAERLMTHLQYAIVVTHHQNLKVKGAGSTLHKFEIAFPIHASFQGVLIRPYKDRPVGDGFAEGKLELDGVHFSALHGFEHSHIGVQRGIAHHDMGHQQQFFALQALTQIGLQGCRHACAPSLSHAVTLSRRKARQRASPRASAIVKISLSPRPDWLMKMTASAPRYGASCKAVTKACALSSAGIMPSRRMTSVNASKTSASVTASTRMRPIWCR